MDGQLIEEIRVIVERLSKIKTACLEVDASSIYTCKSYYQQTQSHRKRFYEILPILRHTQKRLGHQSPSENREKIPIGKIIQYSDIDRENHLFRFVSETTGKAPVTINLETNSQKAAIGKPPPVQQFVLKKPTLRTEIKPSGAVKTSASMAELLKSYLARVTDEVDSLTTDIEKRFFELEAACNNNLMVNVVQNSNFQSLGSKTTASSIVFNVNGNSAMNISEPQFNVLGSNEPIFKPVQLPSDTEDEKPDINHLDLNKEVQDEIQEIQSEEVRRRKELFYNRFADTTIELLEGRSIKVSSAFLIEKSSFFDNLLTKSNEINFGYNFSEFKLFLDCLMEFQDCTVNDALQIFPIAHGFKVEKLIEKCNDILKPVELNENLSLTLNMAVSIKCEELVGTVINFLLEKGRIFFFFNEESHYFLLSPESVRELLCHFDIDSFIMKKIFNWAENYLKVFDQPIDLKEFFTKHRIMEKLAVACFETMGVKF